MFPNKSDSWKNLRTPWIIQQWSAGNNTKGWLLLCSLYGLGNWGNDEIGNLPLVKELEIDRGTCMLDFKSLGFFSTYLSRLPITFFFFFPFYAQNATRSWAYSRYSIKNILCGWLNNLDFFFFLWTSFL